MAKQTILLIEDEEDIVQVIEYGLEREGYAVCSEASGEEGIRKALEIQPDLILLDIMLPGMDGLEVCRRMKSNPDAAHIPIIMLTAKSDESDMVVGLEMGADDYVAKPFSNKVLMARIKAALRKTAPKSDGSDKPLRVHDLVIHPGRYEAVVMGKPVKLTATEMKVLKLLAQRPGWVFSRYQIVDLVKGSEYIVSERAVDVQIVGLRKKLGPCGDYIETVRGAGYRFKE